MEEKKGLIEKVDNLAKMIEKLQETIEKREKYFRQLENQGFQNTINSDLEQGSALPHPKYATWNKSEYGTHNCYQTTGGPFPHLYHTQNPQLNNITDMLAKLIDCACYDKKEKELSEKEKRKLELEQQMKELEDKLRELETNNKDKGKEKEIIPKEKHSKCLTIEDLEAFFRKNPQEKPRKYWYNS